MGSKTDSGYNEAPPRSPSMHLQVQPDGLLERAALASGIVPTPVILGFYALGIWKVLQCAHQLGVFDALAAGAATPEEVARATGCDVQGMDMLLTSLAGFGLVRRKAGRTVLTRASARTLVRSSPTALADLLTFGEDLERLLAGLPEAVRTGRHVDLHHSDQPPEFWVRYLGGLASAARFLGAILARLIPLPRGSRRLLDVGGGHGLWAVAFCQQHPHLEATVLDLPAAVAAGREIVAETDVADRVRFEPGDLRTTPWGEGWDTVLIFNVLHNLTEPEARAALRSAASALRPGGMLVVLDGENPGEPITANAAFGAMLFFLLSASRVWPEADLRAWMTEAGFTHIRRRRLLSFPGLVTLTATRPATLPGAST